LAFRYFVLKPNFARAPNDEGVEGSGRTLIITEHHANTRVFRVASVSHGIAANARKSLESFGFALRSFATRTGNAKRRQVFDLTAFIWLRG